MTTQPPPTNVPSTPGKSRPSGVVALVFGIILCFIALAPTLRSMSQFLYSFIYPSPGNFGTATGSLVVAAIFAVPGIFLIRRFVRIRRENRAADAAAAAAYGYQPAGGYAPAAGGYAPAVNTYPPSAAVGAPASSTPAGPPIPTPPAAATPEFSDAAAPAAPAARTAPESGAPAPQQPPVPPADLNAPFAAPAAPPVPPVPPIEPPR
jgi:hypothetical protein